MNLSHRPTYEYAQSSAGRFTSFPGLDRKQLRIPPPELLPTFVHGRAGGRMLFPFRWLAVAPRIRTMSRGLHGKERPALR
jgi:hypothetical protein